MFNEGYNKPSDIIQITNKEIKRLGTH